MAKLRILTPCTRSWDEMSGEGRLRHCDTCDKDVHDLRGMSDDDALAYVRSRGGGGTSMCVRMLVVTTAVAACGTGNRPLPAPAVPVAVQPPAIAAPASPEPTSPPADTDRDGVADAADACPAVPGAASADAHKNGCPQFVVIESMGDLVILQQVHFQRGSHALLAESFPLVDETIQALKNTPALRRVAIEGHASADEPGAQALSEARAKAVLARMVAAGIDPARLVTHGYAASRPIDENTTSEGRARNRRVEFRIVDEAEPAASQDAACPNGPPRARAVKRYAFTTKLVHHAHDYFVQIPARVSEAIGVRGRVPAIVRFGRASEYRGTLMPRGGGRHVVIVNGEARRAAGAVPGDAVRVVIQPDFGPREVPIPEDLADALRQDEVLRDWESMPPGKREHILKWIEQAVHETTRAKRIGLAVEQAHVRREKRLDREARRPQSDRRK